MLRDQPVEDPLRRVPLLLRRLRVAYENLGDQRQEALHLRSRTGRRASVAGRLDVAEDLLERLPV